ncbi:hypothetical protein KJC03_13040 [Mammaliicoccus sciuri]|uniref:hypothetical protein n=1 Tax=Mammaliicoccus sciuri TaxID=1296 RepID=UPI001159FECE|nr:hypothetical protein [Mammaliicoccus sciuri]MCE5042011.1 hypothetical protein [Mammaliicoccus sciuri]
MKNKTKDKYLGIIMQGLVVVTFFGFIVGLVATNINNDLFSIGFVIIFYTFVHIVIRNFANNSYKERYIDMLDVCVLATTISIVVYKIIIIYDVNDPGDIIFGFFALWSMIVIIFVTFMYILIKISKKKGNHWTKKNKKVEE